MPSGDPFTTITNTLRSIAYYMYWTAQPTAKPHEPAVLASGDDVIITGDYAEIIEVRTARNDQGDSELGQIVKKCQYTNRI